MAAGIYVGEERFFRVVTLMAPSFANNSWWEFYNVLLWQSSQHFQTMQAIQDKGFVRHFPKWELETPASHIGSVTPLPGVSQAPVRAELCPELKGVFVCHQIFIEQLLHARHRSEMKAGVRLITRRRRVWQAPLSLLGSLTGHFLREASPGPSPTCYTPIASDSSLCDSLHTYHYSIPVNPTALLDLRGWDWVPGSQVSVLA